LPDGRLFVSLRDRCEGSDTFCDWVAWIGSYEDMVNGGEGDCRILMKKNYDAFDCAYPALEMLADGTLLATTYGGWEPGVQQYILSLRLGTEELQKIPHKSEQVY
ncbi:MAG: exo-alpha-sialidase, partial [Clostridia bacterium]|nr:exo-alpha-sialidase [Clostridia bacterium]